MKRKHRRLGFVFAGMVLLGTAAALMLSVFEESVVFFRSPTDLIEKPIPPHRSFRLGGLVEMDSVVRDGVTTTFRVTDLSNTVAVTYTGLLPSLFKPGQGVVAEGKLDAQGVFVASEVLAKHDETYMPPEVADALRKSGQWKPAEKADMKAEMGKGKP